MISNRSLNKSEQKLFDENPSNGRETIKLAVKALFEERVRYWDDGEDGGNSNAFLHAYWAALLSKNINDDWARRWTNSHEDLDPNSIYSKMDLFNNSLGMEFQKSNLLLNNDDLANAIEDLIDTGKGKIIEDGVLKKSTKENKLDLNIFQSIMEKALSLVSKLIASSHATRNGDGMTPLIFSANQGELESLKLIIKFSDIEAVDNYGDCAIYHAARLKNEEVGLFLLNNKANPNALNLISRNTPLIEAVRFKEVSFAKLLVKFGANINLKDASGFTAFDIAEMEGTENDFIFLKPS
jgi:ankyrin repeat protein